MYFVWEHFTADHLPTNFYWNLVLPSVLSSVIMTSLAQNYWSSQLIMCWLYVSNCCVLQEKDMFSVISKIIPGRLTAVLQLFFFFFFFFCCDGKMIIILRKTWQCLSIISGVELETQEKSHLRVRWCQTQSGEIVRKNIPPQHRERNVFWFSIEKIHRVGGTDYC